MHLKFKASLTTKHRGIIRYIPIKRHKRKNQFNDKYSTSFKD